MENQSTDLESIQNDVIELIKKQRLLRLVEGGKFVKYSTKGQKNKDKFWSCKLSPNHKTLHYGDIDDQRQTQLNELPNRVNVCDISKILIGRDCPHTKDGYIKKTHIDLAFSIVHTSDHHEEYLNFVAPDEKSFSHWTDGLNALLNKDLTSEIYQKDFQILSKIEFKMRSMNKIKQI